MKKTGIKIFLIFLFILVFIFEIVILNNPMTSYNLSIYSQVNDIAFLILVLALLGGISISVWALYYENFYFWNYGFIIVILVNIIIIMLPSELGYTFNISGDLFYHTGYIQTIISTGSFQEDIYPGIHILGALISLMTNTSQYKFVNYFGLIYYMLFILSIYILSNDLLEKKAALFSTLCSSVAFFYFYYTIFPMGYAFISLIFVLFIYNRYKHQEKIELGLLVLIYVLTITFIHPIAAIVLVLALLIFEISNYYLKDYLIQNSPKHSIKKNFSLSFILILIVIFNLWLWNNFRFWEKFVQGFINLFTSELSSTPLTQQAVEGFSMLNLDLLDIFSLFIKIYGHIFIFGVITVFVIILLFKKKEYILKNVEKSSILYLSLIFLIFSSIAIIDFIQPLSELSSGRLIFFPVMFLPIFVGLFLTSINDKLINKNKSLILISIVILFIPFLIGVFSVHQSPITYKTNPAITSANLDGSKWVIDNGDTKTRTIILGLDSLHRYVELNYGFQKTTKYPYQIIGYKIPDHFNYTNSSNFGQNFKKQTYMITRTEFIINIYSELFPEIKRYTKSDFILLEQDNTVNKIYDNGEIENWLII